MLVREDEPSHGKRRFQARELSANARQTECSSTTSEKRVFFVRRMLFYALIFKFSPSDMLAFPFQSTRRGTRGSRPQAPSASLRPRNAQQLLREGNTLNFFPPHQAPLPAGSTHLGTHARREGRRLRSAFRSTSTAERPRSPRQEGSPPPPARPPAPPPPLKASPLPSPPARLGTVTTPEPGPAQRKPSTAAALRWRSQRHLPGPPAANRCRLTLLSSPPRQPRLPRRSSSAVRNTPPPLLSPPPAATLLPQPARRRTPCRTAPSAPPATAHQRPAPPSSSRRRPRGGTEAPPGGSRSRTPRPWTPWARGAASRRQAAAPSPCCHQLPTRLLVTRGRAPSRPPAAGATTPLCS